MENALINYYKTKMNPNVSVSLKAKVKQVYADIARDPKKYKLRELMWKSDKWVTPDQARDALYFIKEYNYFKGKKFYEACEGKDVELKLAREYSVCMYLKGNKSDIEQIRRKTRPDEFSWEKGVARMWWD
jgi:hypothetical protein